MYPGRSASGASPTTTYAPAATSGAPSPEMVCTFSPAPSARATASVSPPSEPRPGQVAADARGRARPQVHLALVDEHHGVEIGRDLRMLRPQPRGRLALERRVAEEARPVVGDQELHQLVAEAADAVVEHDP